MEKRYVRLCGITEVFYIRLLEVTRGMIDFFIELPIAAYQALSNDKNSSSK
jgi:hypothetical protein